MTELRRCEWCGRDIRPTGKPGRPARFCRRSHRQRHYEARRLARAGGLKPGEALISTESLQGLQDKIYLLEAAMEDAEGDLAEEASLRSYTTAFQSIYAAARRVTGHRLEPKAVGGPSTSQGAETGSQSGSPNS